MSDVRTLDQMEWLQEGLYLAFLACDLFAPLNIVLERKFRVDKTIEVDAIWQTPRGGKSGAGLLVEMPKLNVPHPNSQVNTLLGSVVLFEERNLNFTPSVGTMVSAEQWAQLATEFMRGWIIGQSGGLVVEANAIMPADDWIGGDGGVIALRASINQRVSRTIQARCSVPAFDLQGTTVTLTSAEPTIYYTLDGSFPGNPDDTAELGGTSQIYTVPFEVTAGQVVNWMASAPGKFPSHVGTQLIT